jgi:hypothetical protein
MSLNFDGAFAAFEDYLRRALKPLHERIAKLEAATKGTEQLATKGESFERRLSRHADHLAKLETRMQALEKGSK